MVDDVNTGDQLSKKIDLFESDEIFNSIYPDNIQAVAKKHWTRLEVAKKSAQFLAISPDVKILDIGSGSGKFCFAAAHYHPATQFYGVEQRADLVDLCNNLKAQLKINNVTFINCHYLEFKYLVLRNSMFKFTYFNWFYIGCWYGIYFCCCRSNH